MDVPDIFKNRKSIRKFKEVLIPDPLIEVILKAASLAPTARNIQPWEFIVVKNQGMREEISRWTARNAPFLSCAPVCIAVFCQDTKYYLEDGSAATTSILLCASALGFGACWVAGDKKEYAEDIRKLLGVPGSYKLISLIALGIPDESPCPKKRPIHEMIHKERFSR